VRIQTRAKICLPIFRALNWIIPDGSSSAVSFFDDLIFFPKLMLQNPWPSFSLGKAPYVLKFTDWTAAPSVRVAITYDGLHRSAPFLKVTLVLVNHMTLLRQLDEIAQRNGSNCHDRSYYTQVVGVYKAQYQDIAKTNPKNGPP
jgi:hypothetical protein